MIRGFLTIHMILTTFSLWKNSPEEEATPLQLACLKHVPFTLIHRKDILPAFPGSSTYFFQDISSWTLISFVFSFSKVCLI